MLLPMGFDKYVDILCLFRRALCMLMAPHKQSSVYAVKLQDKSRGTHTLSAALFESDRQVDFSNLQDKLGPVHYAESWHSTILIGMECPSRAASFALWHNRQLPRSSAQNVVERPTESFLWWATNARTGRYAIYIVDSIERCPCWGFLSDALLFPTKDVATKEASPTSAARIGDECRKLLQQRCSEARARHGPGSWSLGWRCNRSTHTGGGPCAGS